MLDVEHTPNLGSLIGAIGMLLWLIYGWISLKRRWRAKIKLEGLREATHELSFFVSHSYERRDEPLPEPVNDALDYMDRALAKMDAQERYSAFITGIKMLGEAMGKAARQRGFDEGSQARQGYIRIDLPLHSLHTAIWLADVGFKKLIRYDGLTDPEFETKEQAVHADTVIDDLKAALPPEERHEGIGPSSRTMAIWERFPLPQTTEHRPEPMP
jgi:hypothetical protein